MKTTLHTYHFNLNDPAQREPYVQLNARLRATPGRGRWMNVIPMRGSGYKSVGPGPVELETEHLFDNQWNSDKGRVFDWYEAVNIDDKLIKTGHYLDITDEMIEIRKSTLKCGYTGMQFNSKADNTGSLLNGFNITRKALASPYLKEEDLHLLRVVPVCDDNKCGVRPKLTEDERGFLLELYVRAQSELALARKEELIKELNEEYDSDVETSRIKRDGFLWMIDHGIPIDNCIFYSHRRAFSFGWKSPMPASAQSAISQRMTGFPFEFSFA